MFVPEFAKTSQRVSELLSRHNLHTEIYKGGHNYLKTIGRVMYPFSAHCLMTLYICTKFQKISQRVSELLSRDILKFTKGHYSIKM